MSQINNYLHFFNREQMYFMIFEDFIKYKEKNIKDLICFLNINHENVNLNIRSNEAQKPYSIFISRILNKPNKFKEKIIKKIFPLSVREYLKTQLNKINMQNIEPAPLNYSIKKEIYLKYYVDEIKKLELFLKRDLSDWRY